MIFSRQGFLGHGPFSIFALRTKALSGISDEEAWFEANRMMIARQYPGMFVVIKDHAVRGAYPDFQSAFNAGAAMFGTGFIIKRALEQEPVQRI